MVFLKIKLFFSNLIFLLLLTASVSWAQDWNSWQPDYNDPKQWKLAYLKIIAEFPRSPSKDFLTYTDFVEKISQFKFAEKLPQTFGQLKALFLEGETPTLAKTFRLTQEETAQALVEELSQWKESLSSKKFPSEKTRLEIAMVYCKVLGEQAVKQFLSPTAPGSPVTPVNRYDLRNELLLPIATLLKTDPSWGIRHDLLIPIFMYHIFDGSPFVLDLLEMVVSDPDHRVQLKLLDLLEQAPFSYTLLRPTLLQLIEEDENPRVRAAAQSFLENLAKGQQKSAFRGATDGDLEQLASSAAITEEEAAEPPTTRRKIKGSTRRFQKPKDILTKIITLQKAVDKDAPPFESNDPRLVPFLETLIFSEKDHVYLRISAVELLFHFPDQMMGILDKILRDKTTDKDLKRTVLNGIVQDLPPELIDAVTLTLNSDKDYTVRMLSARALLSAKRPSLNRALLTAEERTRILAKYEPIYRQFPDQFTGMLLNHMKDQEWNPKNVVAALERTYRYYHPSELPQDVELWLNKIHQEGVLRDLVRLKDRSFEVVKPHIERALKISVR